MNSGIKNPTKFNTTSVKREEGLDRLWALGLKDFHTTLFFFLLNLGPCSSATGLVPFVPHGPHSTEQNAKRRSKIIPSGRQLSKLCKGLESEILQIKAHLLFNYYPTLARTNTTLSVNIHCRRRAQKKQY